MAYAYGLSGDKINEIMSDEDKENIERNLSIEKAVDIIISNSVEVEEENKENEAENS